MFVEVVGYLLQLAELYLSYLKMKSQRLLKISEHCAPVRKVLEKLESHYILKGAFSTEVSSLMNNLIFY